MDPYIKISTRQQQFKTKTKNSAGKTPVWNETFNIDVKYVGDDITMQVYDEDVGSDDIIGEIQFKLAALCIGNGMDEWFAIAYRGKAAGQIHLKSVWKAGGAGGAKAGGAAQQ
jgi:Ca2+-dependent lipid-binding protein